jgi:16S rRNA (adenine(1408)-N(1))-methyltransferase
LAEKHGAEDMEYIHGKHTYTLDATDFAARLPGYQQIVMDMGTGDGRYVAYVARRFPERFVIGIDTCRENLQQVSRKSLPNALYVIANAEALPVELSGLASHITVNFPWGSLLTGLLTSGSKVIENMGMIARPEATLEIWLNSSALQKEGLSLEQGGAMVQQALRMSGFDVKPPVMLDAEALRHYPTTWAKRLGYGRDPQALSLSVICPGSQEDFVRIASLMGPMQPIDTYRQAGRVRATIR